MPFCSMESLKGALPYAGVLRRKPPLPAAGGLSCFLVQFVCQAGLETVKIRQIRAKQKPGYLGG
jgi:hypothetical protein